MGLEVVEERTLRARVGIGIGLGLDHLEPKSRRKLKLMGWSGQPCWQGSEFVVACLGLESC